MDGWMGGGRKGGGRRRFNLTRLSKSSFTELDENEAADQPTESDGRTDGRTRSERRVQIQNYATGSGEEPGAQFNRKKPD